MKTLLRLSLLLTALICTQIYHKSATAFNVKGWWGSVWQKNEQETITKEFPVDADCVITLYNTEGSYTIKPWGQKKITIEVTKKGTADELKGTTITTKIANKEASIITRVPEDQKSATVDYVLMVPQEASINITQTKGPIRIKGVLGSITVSVQDGTIDIADSTQSVVAKNGSGDIKIKQKLFDEPHALFLESLKGNITLHLPRETKAALHAKSGSGNIISDHPVTLAQRTMKINKENWEFLKKDFEGTLGGLNGGAPITLETIKGTIAIKEY